MGHCLPKYLALFLDFLRTPHRRQRAMRLRACFPPLFLFAVSITCEVARAQTVTPPDQAVVLGFDRFSAKSSDQDKLGMHGGLLLVGELGCISCHKPEGRAAS